MSEMNQLENEIKTLQQELQRQKEEAARIRQRTADENRRRLDAFEAETRYNVSRQNSATRQEYDRLLKEYQKSLNKELRDSELQLDRNYQRLLSDIQKNEEKWKEKNRELDRLIADLKKKSATRDEAGKQEAEKNMIEAGFSYKLVEKKPHEKFFPKRLKAYDTAIQEAKSLYQSGLMEAAIAVSISVRSGLNRLGFDIDEQYEEWERKYLIFQKKTLFLLQELNEARPRWTAMERQEDQEAGQKSFGDPDVVSREGKEQASEISGRGFRGQESRNSNVSGQGFQNGGGRGNIPLSQDGEEGASGMSAREGTNMHTHPGFSDERASSMTDREGTQAIINLNYWTRGEYTEIAEWAAKFHSEGMVKGKEALYQYLKKNDSLSLEDLEKNIEKLDSLLSRLKDALTVSPDRYRASCQRADWGEALIDYLENEINLEWIEEESHYRLAEPDILNRRDYRNYMVNRYGQDYEPWDMREWLELVFRNSSGSEIFIYIIPYERNLHVENRIVVCMSYSGAENIDYSRQIYRHIQDCLQLTEDDGFIQFAAGVEELKENMNPSLRAAGQSIEGKIRRLS
ncbi:MAG: hypothetical protein K5989_10990 [Lachnospiraceae bacterium]|nr:hypothetical protein [Lachnospiraceae bacterium]